jgi:hypothetical protein
MPNRWDSEAKKRAIKWFGTDSDELRTKLMGGYQQCLALLKDIKDVEIVKADPDADFYGCIPNNDYRGAVALVCPEDGDHHIGILPSYCNLSMYTTTNADSKLATILHEVTHFNDVFKSKDTIYTAYDSQRLAKNNPT